MRKISEKYRTYAVCLILTAITLAVFWQVRNYNFINYDDREYITENQNIRCGLTLKGIKWAFTEPHFFMWHPVTSLSHMLDCQLFGLNPRGHHLTNLIFHIANSLLLFTILRQMTGALWRSAFVAAVFAIHPLNVESVAWVAERKTVLSGFFWLLTIAAYVRYVKRPRIANYLLVVLVFSLALMSKPMAVTLPFVLLLLDYWPLNRIENISFVQASLRQTIFRLVREKIPLFILSAICSSITLLAQRSGEVVVKLVDLPLHLRLTNMVLSYVKYIGKMVWPKGLAAFYPFNANELTSGWVLVALAFLLVASLRVIQLAPTCGYLPVGWFWFVGTLVPVIGIVQSGSQALADRYTYMPLIGLFIIVAWGGGDFFSKLTYRKVILSILAFTALSALTICTRFQVRYWQSGTTLFEHALKISKNDPVVLNKFATALAEEGRFEEAAEYYRIAVQLYKNPDSDMFYNIGCVYNNLGRYTEAVDAFRQAIKIDPRNIEAYCNLGTVYGQLGRYTEAIDTLRQAAQLRPDFAEVHYGLCVAYLMSGDKNSAVKEHEILKTLDPQKANTLLNLMSK